MTNPANTSQRARRGVVSFIAAVAITACASSGMGEARNLLDAPRSTLSVAKLDGHAPSPEMVLADRDELLGVLDSLYAHYARMGKRSTSTARWVAIGAMVAGSVGAASSAIVDGDRAERKLAQGASALTALLAGLSTEFQLVRKSESQRQCKAALYHALSDVRLRYGNASLPVTDLMWSRYITFKDSVDRNITLNCD